MHCCQVQVGVTFWPTSKENEQTRYLNGRWRTSKTVCSAPRDSRTEVGKRRDDQKDNNWPRGSVDLRICPRVRPVRRSNNPERNKRQVQNTSFVTAQLLPHSIYAISRREQFEAWMLEKLCFWRRERIVDFGLDAFTGTSSAVARVDPLFILRFGIKVDLSEFRFADHRSYWTEFFKFKVEWKFWFVLSILFRKLNITCRRQLGIGIGSSITERFKLSGFEMQPQVLP